MSRTLLLTIVVCLLSSDSASAVDGARFRIEDSWEIATVPADFPVRFCLLTTDKRQYIAYYNEQRSMTVAARMLDSNEWQYKVLPTKVGWDSHNFIEMAVDHDRHLHVSGNMHCVKLIYFRTEAAGDITTLKRLPMTGKREERATYPKFMTDHKNRLVFSYRDGGSGNGVRIYNQYDLATRSWTRLLDSPLLDGQGKRNAYPQGPVRGPDGWFHLVWLWRDTPDCATNNHLCHARSQDLIHWQSIFGEKVELPLVLNDEALWVDPVPSGGGIINGCEKLSFDQDKRPIISYHKSDAEGNMQVYAARPEGDKWVRHLLTDWSKPIEFSGTGSMGYVGIRISELSPVAPGLLTMTYRHRDYGQGRLLVDEETLRPLKKKIEVVREYPNELDRIKSSYEGMQIQRVGDIGNSDDQSVRYLLQWESLGRNRDRRHAPPLPKPSVLRLYKLRVNGEASKVDMAS